MDLVFLDALKTIATPVITIAGAIYAVQRVNKGFQKSRELEKAQTLQAAKEADAVIKADLENKIDKIKSDFLGLKSNMNKDLSHIKETHDNKIKYLAEKIEELRDQINIQHAQLVSLLTKLVEKD